MDEPMKNYSSGCDAAGVRGGRPPRPRRPAARRIFAVGDEAFQEKCRRTMERFVDEGRTIVFVSHAASR